jgi:hypothetical protein
MGGAPSRIKRESGHLWRAGPLVGLACALWLAGCIGGANAFAASVAITGPEQIIFDQSQMSCGAGHYPDESPRAFRDSRGRIQLTITHYSMRRMIGPDFDHLTSDCRIARDSSLDPFPGNFDDRNWITAPYTFDGTEVFTLQHVEYHGELHPGMCALGNSNFCSFNVVTFARSTDAGDSYASPPPPSQLVASVPYTYVPETGRWGLFSTSNVLEKDGYYYVMVLVRPYLAQRGGTCLMRTKTLGDPASWRAWDGAGFTVRFVNPYLEPSASPTAHVCQPVSNLEIGQLQRSLTYNSYLNKFFVIGIEEKFDPARQAAVRGIYYSFSDDLIHWSDRQLLIEAPSTCVIGGQTPMTYPSVIDPQSTRRNFDSVGRTGHLYYTRRYTATCANDDRDLARVPVEFSP